MFLVQRQVGVALYGDVWLCSDVRDHNRPVVIKQVHLDVARRDLAHSPHLDDPWVESLTLATLAMLGPHDNVLQARQQFQQDDTWFVVTDYCDGGDLWQRLELSPHRRLPEPEALAFFAQIVSGVQLLHSNGIAHRDLSLENVLLSRDVCKICDFGLSTKADRVCRGRVGKAYYMAPEVVAGGDYDPRAADIWSLGIVLFVMLTGSPLVSIASVEEKAFLIVQQHGVDSVLEAWNMGDLVSLATVHLLMGMLQTDPSDRFTIEDVVADPAMLRR